MAKDKTSDLLIEQYQYFLNKMSSSGILVVVSKQQSLEKINLLYQAGCRDFGENKVQDLLKKKEQLPQDIRWHFLGSLQRNKVKYISNFIHLIHSVDRLELLEELEKEGKKINKKISILLQFHIAQEIQKQGFSIQEKNWAWTENLNFFNQFSHLNFKGVMGMASLTENQKQISQEFGTLNFIFNHLKQNYFSHQPNFYIKSMGMSSDYELALAEKSNCLRIGNAIFGK